MLYQFSFQNFRSYRSETISDFQATAIPEFADCWKGLGMSLKPPKAGDLNKDCMKNAVIALLRSSRNII